MAKLLGLIEIDKKIKTFKNCVLTFYSYVPVGQHFCSCRPVVNSCETLWGGGNQRKTVCEEKHTSLASTENWICITWKVSAELQDSSEIPLLVCVGDMWVCGCLRCLCVQKQNKWWSLKLFLADPGVRSLLSFTLRTQICFLFNQQPLENKRGKLVSQGNHFFIQGQWKLKVMAV